MSFAKYVRSRSEDLRLSLCVPPAGFLMQSGNQIGGLRALISNHRTRDDIIDTEACSLLWFAAIQGIERK